MFAHATRQIAVFLFCGATLLYPISSAGGAENEEAKALRETLIRIKAGMNSGISFNRFSMLTSQLYEDFEIYKYATDGMDEAGREIVANTVNKTKIARLLWTYMINKECNYDRGVPFRLPLILDLNNVNLDKETINAYAHMDYDYICGVKILRILSKYGVPVEKISHKPWSISHEFFFAVRNDKYASSILSRLAPKIENAIISLK